MSFDLDRIGGDRAYRALIDAVVEAGEHALSLQRRGVAARVEKKPDRSPVTEADRAVEERLRDHVGRHHPGTGFFGEETGRSGAGAALEWVVDPIDGTRAFLRDMPTWSVLVALVDRGEPVVAVAYMPTDGDLFTAVKGQGAFANGRPCGVSAVASLEDAAVSHGGLGQFHAHGSLDVLPRLAAQAYTTRGFADFDGYRQLLLGRVDAMIDPDVKPYDIAAPYLLVHEAGGRMTSMNGEARIDGGSGLASNGRVHDELLALVRGPLT